MNRIIRTVARTASAVTTAVVLAAPEPGEDPTADLELVIDDATKWIAGIAFAIATLCGTAGLALYMMAGGDTTQLERAKVAFKAAAVGYAGVILTPVFMGILGQILGEI
ncbi:pilin [Phytohabitans sp. LJ34]|uniref:pilin n=1 Tax=Phytohabitans sp. LJ34 TaxID=3452217 RepID=UPI003F8C19B6